jgi:hypothetical protein
VRRRGLLLAATLLAACEAESGPRFAAEAGLPESPPFDAAWRISTHNSYWIDHGASGDLFASGTQERLADQLLFDHARGVEIDVHKDPDVPGAFRVYHTTPGNGLCDTLPGCLAALRAFHHALPRHEAVHVTLELKEISAPLFDATHTIADLDHALATELGEMLYRPADFLARCPGARTLSACARAAGWPTMHALRGRFVISVLGNWDGLPGAQATKDFVDYATSGDIRDRAAFPMASSWQLDHDKLNGPIADLVTQDDLDRALTQSVFLQVEDTADPRLAPFAGGHGVVRIDGASAVADQEQRIALRAQLLQSDSPWIQADDHGAAEPFRALVQGFDDDVTREPGSRLSLSPGAAGERVFAYAREDASATVAWETAVSSGVDASRVGCLRAAAALGSDDASVTVCRAKIPAVRDPDAGAASPDAERAIVRVTVCAAGACTTTEHKSREPSAEGPGDLLRIELSPLSGGTCVRVRSATAADADLTPRWEDLDAPACFTAPLGYVGLSTEASASFFGTRREQAGTVADIGAADFAGVVAEGAGGYHDAAALLADTSFH